MLEVKVFSEVDEVKEEVSMKEVVAVVEVGQRMVEVDGRMVVMVGEKVAVNLVVKKVGYLYVVFAHVSVDHVAVHCQNQDKWGYHHG